MVMMMVMDISNIFFSCFQWVLLGTYMNTSIHWNGNMCIHVMFTICEKQHRSFSTSDFSRCRIAMTVMWTLRTFLSGERSSIGKSQALECLPPIVGKRSAFLYWLKPPWHAMVHVISTTKCKARLKI